MPKTKRNWTTNEDFSEVTCDLGTFPVGDLTENGKTFALLYGMKQILADSIAGKGGAEYSDKERADAMSAKHAYLCNPKCTLEQTDKGFRLVDPDASRGGMTALQRAEAELKATTLQATQLRSLLKDQGTKPAQIKSIVETMYGPKIDELKAKIKELSK